MSRSAERFNENTRPRIVYNSKTLAREQINGIHFVPHLRGYSKEDLFGGEYIIAVRARHGLHSERYKVQQITS